MRYVHLNGCLCAFIDIMINSYANPDNFPSSRAVVGLGALCCQHKTVLNFTLLLLHMSPGMYLKCEHSWFYTCVYACAAIENQGTGLSKPCAAVLNPKFKHSPCWPVIQYALISTQCPHIANIFNIILQTQKMAVKIAQVWKRILFIKSWKL